MSRGCGVLIIRHGGRGLAWAVGFQIFDLRRETVDAGDPGHTFREMLRSIRRRYSIYYAMPAGKPGSSRRVEVALSPQGRTRYPDAQVLARKGYVMPKGAGASQ